MSGNRAGRLAGFFETVSLWLAGGWVAATTIVLVLWFRGADPRSITFLKAMSYQDLAQGLLFTALAMFATWMLVVIDRRLDDHIEGTVAWNTEVASLAKAITLNLEATTRLVEEVRLLRDESGYTPFDDEDEDDIIDDEDDLYMDDDDEYLDSHDLDDNAFMSIPDHGREGQSPIKTSY